MKGLKAISTNTKGTIVLSLIIAFVLAFTGQAWAAVTLIDNGGANWSAASIDTTTTHTYTMPAGTDRVVVVSIAAELASVSVTGVTVGGVSAQMIGQSTQAAAYNTDWYAIMGTGTSASANIVVTWNTNPTSATAISAATYGGVLQVQGAVGSGTAVNTAGTATGTASPITTGNITVLAGGQVIGDCNENTASTGTVSGTAWTMTKMMTSAYSTSGNGVWEGDGSAATGTITCTFTQNRATLVAFSLAPAPSGDALSTSNNQDLSGGNPTEGATLMMQSFQVDSSFVDDGQVTLDSLTIQDDGNATAIDTVNVYIDIVNGLCDNTQLIGTTSSWDGSSTSITLDQGTRTVSNGTSKWVCVEYVIPSTGQTGNTIQSNVTAVGVASPDSGATSVGTSTQRTIQACSDPTPSTITVTASQSYYGNPFDVSGGFTNTGNASNFEFFVYNGDSVTGPSEDEPEYFDNDETTCDFVNWTAATGTGTLCTDPMGNGQFGTHVSAVADNADGTHTPSAGTGPSSLHSGTHGTNGGFAYIEASGTGPYTATLTRNALFNATATELHISFAYSAYGANGIELKLEAQVDGGGWVTEWSVTTDDGNAGAWTFVDLNLFAGAGASTTAYTSGMVELRFSWNMNSFAGDWAIDTIRVYGPGRLISGDVTCTDWQSSSSIPATTGGGSTCGDYADSGTTHKLDVRGTDPDCNETISSSGAESFTWYACTDPDESTITIDPPTTGSTIKGVQSITATVTGEDTGPNNYSNMKFTASGSSSCDVSDVSMTDQGGGVWTGSWDTTLCGGPPETGVSISVSGVDPDCSTTRNAQSTNLYLDNTDPFAVTGCYSCHSNPPADAPSVRNTPEGAVVGSHSAHVDTVGLDCTVCHVDNGAISDPLPQGSSHRDGIIQMASTINGTANAYNGVSAFIQVENPTTYTCDNTYCHSNGTSVSTGSIPNHSSPQWGVGTADCTTCHGKPPAYANTVPVSAPNKANSHLAHPSNCTFCHAGTTTDGGNTIANPAYHGNNAYNVEANAGQFSSYSYATGGGTCYSICCHGNNDAQWGVTPLGCDDCHSVAVCSPNAEALDSNVSTRRAVMGEFGQTWNHSAADSYDCGVCHMEGAVSGSQTTGEADSTYHANGWIELRDGDTGSTIKNVTWSGPNAGSYSDDAEDGKFVRFSRDLDSPNLEDNVTAIQINHCLDCHDSDGSTVYAPGGGTTNPFASGVSPVNVDAHFDTANKTYHPVKGKQNNTYADNDAMASPWNGIDKTEGTLDANSWGYLISCWDCHASSGATGVQTSTVTAHGGADTIKGTIYVNNPTLCMGCHTGKYSQTQGHASGSAFTTTNGNMDSNFMPTCHACHSSWRTGALPTSPARAEDVHGYNTRVTGAAFPNANNGYSFLRSEGWYGTTYQQTPGSCTGYDGATCSRSSMGSYTPGGTY